jgi:predicted GIY-YIG superfamily endonuclease
VSETTMTETKLLLPAIPTQLYRHFDKDGALLYVGISLSAVARLAQHKAASAWFKEITKIDVCEFPSREDALAAERAAIHAEKPKHNIIHAKFVRRAGSLPSEAAADALIRRVVNFELLYDMSGVADALKLTTTMVGRLVRSGELNSVQIRGRYYCTGWNLIEFLENLEAASKGEAP